LLQGRQCWRNGTDPKPLNIIACHIIRTELVTLMGCQSTSPSRRKQLRCLVNPARYTFYGSLRISLEPFVMP
ncbi:hypothetical protein, partial [Vibrio ostreicida]|uniref:hypothetical protein n=1 Tax=Vibrio ostreicida TaxID=526588 RepID=UPI00406C35A4